MNIDSSCLQDGKLLPFDTSDAHRQTSFPRLIMRFSSMILERMTSGREDASDECMGIGLSCRQCEDDLLNVVVRSFLMTHEEDPDDVDQRTRERLHQFATLGWMVSHHRN